MILAEKPVNKKKSSFFISSIWTEPLLLLQIPPGEYEMLEKFKTLNATLYNILEFNSVILG